MTETSLLPTEKKVLAGLLRHPKVSDRGLASEIGLKPSTTTAIKRRLQGEGLWSTRQFPAFQKLSCEILSISYVSLGSYPALSKRIELSKEVVDRPEFVFCLMDPRQDFLVQIARNLTDVMRNINDLESLYEDGGYISRPITSVVFPFELSFIPSLFDYAPLIEKEFWPDSNPGPLRDIQLSDVGSEHLRNKEKVVLQGFVSYPSASDVELSENINVSRMTIGRARNRFISRNLLHKMNIPDLRRIGFQLLVVTHGVFRPTLSNGLKRYLPDLISTLGPVVFFAMTTNNVVFVNAFSSFEKYKESLNAFAEMYKERDIFLQEPNRILFSLSHTEKVKDHEFAPLLSKILGPSGPSYQVPHSSDQFSG